MANARMRHFNSPEEVALRQGTPEAERKKPAGFMHFNHPEAIAARARGGTPEPVVVVEQKQRPVAPAAERAELQTLATGIEPRAPRRARNGDPQSRLEQLESFVYGLLDDAHQAREFRMQLLNLQATTDSQLALGNRLRALEESFDQVPFDKLLELEGRVSDLEDDDDQGDEGEVDEGDDDEGDDDDTKGDTQPPPGGPAAPPATEPTT